MEIKIEKSNGISRKPNTLNENIQRVLDLYDGKVENQQRTISKGFFRTYLPFYNSPIIKKIRELKEELDIKIITNEQAKKMIQHLINNDDNYPYIATATVQAEYILDYIVLNGEIYLKKKEKWDTADELWEVMMLKNLIHFGDSDMIVKSIQTDSKLIQFNRTLISAIANASCESVNFLLTYCPQLVNLEITDDQLKNNALMIAIAKGRYHKDTLKNSTIFMSVVIDKLFDLSTKQSINIQDKLGMTALHLAVLQGDIESIKIILKLGGDPILKNMSQNTPEDLLVVSYEEASEHLGGYTHYLEGREEYILRCANNGLLETLVKSICGEIYTMPTKTEWESAKSTISEIIREARLDSSSGLPFSNLSIHKI